MTDTCKPAQLLLHDADDPHARQTAIARLRDMSRDERLALLMRNFSMECGALGMPRRGAAAARQAAPRPLARAQENGRESAQESGRKSGHERANERANERFCKAPKG